MTKSKTLDAFAKQHRYCWLCGYSLVNSWRRLEIHHIARGPHRANGHSEECNLIRTCGPCHSEKLDGMPIARQLCYVKTYNPAAYDRQRVNTLRRREPDAVTEADVDAELSAILPY